MFSLYSIPNPFCCGFSGSKHDSVNYRRSNPDTTCISLLGCLEKKVRKSETKKIYAVDSLSLFIHFVERTVCLSKPTAKLFFSFVLLFEIDDCTEPLLPPQRNGYAGRNRKKKETIEREEERKTT